MKRKLLLAIMIVLAAHVATIGWSQEKPGLQVQSVQVTVADRSGRPFNDGVITATLAFAPGYESGQTIGTESVQFTVGEGSKSYPIHDGQADLKLLVPADASNVPFKYQFSAKEQNGDVFLTRSIEVSGSTRTLSLNAPDKHAPMNAEEEGGGVFFSLAAVGLILATFFFLAFRRMLFNRRMEVSSATLWSYILTFLFLVIAASTVIVAFMTPDLFSTAANTYLGLAIIFLGCYLLGTTLMILFTRPRAARS